MKPILLPNRAGRLRIWTEPHKDSRYVIGADVAEGRVRDLAMQKRKLVVSASDRPDYSTAIVLDYRSGAHVATWHGDIEPIEYAVTLAALGIHYNEALMVPEINGPGLAVIEYLNKVLHYPNLYRSKVWNNVVSDPLAAELGWRTTRVTRPLLIARIQEVVNNRALETGDQELVKELRTMVYDPQGVPRAMGRDKDDRVLALGMALQARFEMLYGTVVPEKKPDDRLGAYDQMVWKAAERLLAESREHAERRDNPAHGLRPPSLPRPSE